MDPFLFGMSMVGPGADRGGSGCGDLERPLGIPFSVWSPFGSGAELGGTPLGTVFGDARPDPGSDGEAELEWAGGRPGREKRRRAGQRQRRAAAYARRNLLTAGGTVGEDENERKTYHSRW